MNIKNRLTSYFKAGYSGLYLTSYEEARVEADIAAVAAEIGFQLYVWTITDSLVGPMGDEEPKQLMNENGEVLDPFSLLPFIKKRWKPQTEGKEDDKVVFLLKDFHIFLQDQNPMMIRLVKDFMTYAKSCQKRVVVLGCQFKLVAELEKEFTVVEFELPTREDLRLVLNGIGESASIHLNGNTDKILDAAMGMTTTEAADAFALAVVESGGQDIHPEVVAREKSNVVKKNGLLEIVSQKVTLDDIGGLENLKSDLYEKRNLFTKEARDYGLVSPRGALVVGQPGTGKSLTATATGQIFNIPLVKLEAGKLFGSLVGQSELNWRTAFATAKAIAPCCFWVDEIDGLVSGAKSSGQTDGGTTARVVKAILQDMQFNSDGIFYIFTANDIDGLPDPLIDRLDVWSVDLPNQTEREAIWRIHIAKQRNQTSIVRDPKDYSVATIASMTDGFSGRQIEQVWLAAMTRAFNDGRREPTTDDVTYVSSQFVPTSKTMATQIEERRKRLENRAKPASATETAAPARKGRKLSV